MEFKNKKLTDMSDDELATANSELQAMQNEVEWKRTNPKFRKKFLNQPLPPINPAFTDLMQAVQNEIKKRVIQ